jgi:hypothetical protein
MPAKISTLLLIQAENEEGIPSGLAWPETAHKAAKTRQKEV